MVVSLYVCQIPENVTKEDLINVFSEVSGYIDTRIKIMSDKAKIAFIDFEDEKNAKFAKDTLQGFKFTKDDKGIIIKFSENSRHNKNNKNERNNNEKNSNFGGRKRKRFINNERNKNSNNNENNKNNTSTNNSKNPTNNPIEALVNNPLLRLLEQSTNQNQNVLLNNQNNQSNQNQLLKNLTLLASVQNTNFNNTIQNNNLNLNNKLDSLVKKYENVFLDFENLKNHASNIVYVEGIPIDAKEREVAHIFRPFPGYKSLRLIQKEKNGENTILCFADFENVIQSTICINTLQGYRFDKNDLVGLHCSYGVSKNKKH